MNVKRQAEWLRKWSGAENCTEPGLASAAADTIERLDKALAEIYDCNCADTYEPSECYQVQKRIDAIIGKARGEQEVVS